MRGWWENAGGNRERYKADYHATEGADRILGIRSAAMRSHDVSYLT